VDRHYSGASEVSLYTCHRASAPITIDGNLDKPAWRHAPKSRRFVDITTGRPGPFDTRAAALWDGQNLYIAFWIAEPSVEAALTERDSLIFNENDVEVFIDGGDCYYEFEINALGTIWELTLDKPYSKGGTATHGTNLPGLKSAVKVQGTLNGPKDYDTGWTVEVFLPWKDLATYQGKLTSPPKAGDTWRINFSRVEWKHRVKGGKYVRFPEHGVKIPDGEHPEDNWVWSPQGAVNMHLPEMWGRLKFAE
jgi:hypothetical protein